MFFDVYSHQYVEYKHQNIYINMLNYKYIHITTIEVYIMKFKDYLKEATSKYDYVDILDIDTSEKEGKED